MDQNEIAARVLAVYNTLNLVEVRGFNNVTNLAGSLQISKELLQNLQLEEQTKYEE